MYLLVSFIVQNIKKVFKVDPEFLRILEPILGPILARLIPTRCS